MRYPLDEVRLERVRGLMDARDLDALVVRSPDNVFYLSNYWGMKGWETLVFPREGPPTLVAIDPQSDTVADNYWFDDTRYFPVFDPQDPRPPFVAALDLTTQVLRERGLTGRVGVELNNFSQGVDRMVGEPSVYTQGYFDALAGIADTVDDATFLLFQSRMIKTEQEIERMKRTNRLAADAVQHVRDNIASSMRESEVAAMFEGYVHCHGIGYEGVVEMARGFSLCLSGSGIRTFHATGGGPVREDEPTLMEIWVVADGYWNDLTKNACPGSLTPRYGELLDLLLSILEEATRDHVGDGASLADLDGFIRARSEEAGHRPPPHHVCHGVGVRAHEPPWAHPKSDEVMREGMVLAIEPGIYWEDGGGLRLEDNFLVTATGCERLSPAPDDFRR